MALRSPALWMGNPAVQHTAQNDRLHLSGLFRPEVGSTAANRPLTAAAGVLHGPPGTTGEVTVLSNTQFTVNPARWVVNSSASALGGTYEVTNDAVTTLPVTAQNATQTRRSYFGVWVIDSFVAGSGDDLPHWGLIDGPLAASNPQLPSAGSLPANFLALGEFLIPPTGQAVTYTPYEVTTGLRGAVIPIAREASLQTVNAATGATTVVTAGSYDGETRQCVDTKARAVWDATAGRWVFFDSVWQAYTLTVSTAAAPPWTEITYGAAKKYGRYFRKGREVSVQGYFEIGSGTAFAGLSILRFGVPPGLAPAAPPLQGTGNNLGMAGAARASGSATLDGLLQVDYYFPSGAAANRRLLVNSASDVILQGGSSPSWNLTAVGHFAIFSGTYETAFEA